MRGFVFLLISKAFSLRFSLHEELIASSTPVGDETIECYTCEFVYNATDGTPFIGDQRCRDNIKDLPNNSQTFPAKIQTNDGFTANVVCATFNLTFHQSVEIRDNNSDLKEVQYLGIFERTTFLQYVGSTLEGYEGTLKMYEHEYGCGRNTSTCSGSYDPFPRPEFKERREPCGNCAYENVLRKSDGNRITVNGNVDCSVKPTPPDQPSCDGEQKDQSGICVIVSLGVGDEPVANPDQHLLARICDAKANFLDWGFTNAYIDTENGMSVCATSKCNK
ncbi:Oidioi.mRNA.OKI2018_I69.chr1.g1306.t1.cds [Oikopleura dioica]|uniref:Oidioi.mRNA.OKI2018_I69.chr1.g1306.t1.cds n=1 Tax=Oikopleura dioica TaxID=34765 RepID=A0ABN7SMI0_OIKDI|nr:Oidioi.mRNA.OKI2018_I69.chr1.g1306.t1.cds [Oikopleura dioica]